MRLQNESNIKIIVQCTLAFLIISYLIFRTALPKPPLIFLYNLIIIVSHQSLSLYRSLFFLGGSVFLTILASLAMDFYYVWNLPVFFITFLIVDDRRKRSDYYTHIIENRVEEIKENINLLLSEYERHKRDAIFLEKKEERYRLLRNITSSLSSTLSLDKVSELILDSALQIIQKTESALLFLVDTRRQELNLATSRVRKETGKVMAKKGDLLDEWVFKQRQCLIVEDIKKDFRFSDKQIGQNSRSFRSVISCPLMEERKVIGIVRLENPRPNNYTSEDLRLLDILCDLGAVSLQNARFYKRTLDLAITDGLTGLYLRRHFVERLDEEILRCLRNNLEFSLLMIDIDNFKNYNDEYGHTAGDIVLKTLAMVLKNEVGANGIVSRYGGEEFSIILPEVTKEKAIRIADDLRKAVKRKKIEFRRKKTGVTISIGISCFPEDAKVHDELILKADARLYAAKRQGRDRVVSK